MRTIFSLLIRIIDSQISHNLSLSAAIFHNQKIKFSLITIVFLLLTANIYPQDGWFWQYPKPQGNTLRDIHVFDSTTAIAVGDIGTIIKTIDGGESWDVQHHAGGTDIDLYGVHFTDELNGWACGGISYSERNVLLKTTDGGESWERINTNNKLPLNAVHFVDKDTGIVVGEDGIVLRTTDGGENWDVRNLNDYIGVYLDIFQLHSITFINKSTGWIVGNGYYRNEIFKTTDCGKTWQWNEWVVNPKVGGLLDIQFCDNNYGFIVGGGGKFLKTTNGGAAWQVSDLAEKYNKEEYEYFYSVYFTDSLNGCIAGGSYYAFLLRTSDGGENWIEEINNNDKMIHHFYKLNFSNKYKGWIVGQFGMIYKTNDSGENWIAQIEERFQFNSIYFVNENTGWAVGEKGIILHTVDGGSNWEKQYQNDSLLLNSVYATSENNVFAVGALLDFDYNPVRVKNAIRLLSTDCGQTWEKQISDNLYSYNSIFFVNEEVGWITAGLALLKTTDKGDTWNKISSEINTPKREIQFINESIGWGSMNGGNYLYKTINGGKNWENLFIDSNFAAHSFCFINDEKGWAAGVYHPGKTIYKTCDGGQTWNARNNTPISNYNSIYFVNEITGWAVGGYYLTQQKSSIIKTTDGGENWFEQKSPPSNELIKVFFINENTGWAITDGIIKTTNGGGLVSVFNESKKPVSNKISLYQNYPNPFNPSTVISLQIPGSDFVSLKVYDILGKEITTLINEEKIPGEYKVEFNGSGLASGIYFYRLQAGEYSITKKMILLR